MENFALLVRRRLLLWNEIWNFSFLEATVIVRGVYLLFINTDRPRYYLLRKIYILRKLNYYYAILLKEIKPNTRNYTKLKLYEKKFSLLFCLLFVYFRKNYLIYKLSRLNCSPRLSKIWIWSLLHFLLHPRKLSSAHWKLSCILRKFNYLCCYRSGGWRRHKSSSLHKLNWQCFRLPQYKTR